MVVLLDHMFSMFKKAPPDKFDETSENWSKSKSKVFPIRIHPTAGIQYLRAAQINKNHRHKKY